MVEIIAFVSFFVLVAAWLAAPRDVVAETMPVAVPSSLPVAEAKA